MGSGASTVQLTAWPQRPPQYGRLSHTLQETSRKAVAVVTVVAAAVAPLLALCRQPQPVAVVPPCNCKPLAPARQLWTWPY